MIIDESKIIEENDEPLALACLLADGVCYLNGLEYGKRWGTGVFVNANDVFAWALADGEPIEQNDYEDGSQIIDLYKRWKKDNKWGRVKWLCVKRNEKPQNPIVVDMQKDGAWDDEMERLPENKFDKRCRELRKDL